MTEVLYSIKQVRKIVCDHPDMKLSFEMGEAFENVPMFTESSNPTDGTSRTLRLTFSPQEKKTDD